MQRLGELQAQWMSQGGVRTPGKATPPHLCDFAMERPPPLPPGAVAVVDDFLHGALHVILHARRVFPPDVFERRRLFDVAVFRSRHMELDEYITGVVLGARHLLERRELDALVVRPGATGAHCTPRRPRALPDRRQAARCRQPLSPRRCSTCVRGFLLRLHVCDALLAPLPAGAELSFTAELHTRSTSASQPLPAALREAWAETDAGAGPHGGCAAAAGAMAGAGRAEPFVVPLSSLDVLSVLAKSPPIRPTHPPTHTYIPRRNTIFTATERDDDVQDIDVGAVARAGYGSCEPGRLLVTSSAVRDESECLLR